MAVVRLRRRCGDHAAVHRSFQHGQARLVPGDHISNLARIRADPVAVFGCVRRSVGRVVHSNERRVGTPATEFRSQQVARDGGSSVVAVHSRSQLPRHLHEDPFVGARRPPLPGLQRSRLVRPVRVSLGSPELASNLLLTSRPLQHLKDDHSHRPAPRHRVRQDSPHDGHLWRIPTRWYLPPFPHHRSMRRSSCWNDHGERSKGASGSVALRRLPRRRNMHLASRVRRDWRSECLGRSNEDDY